jgi:hypothetical protein
LWGIDATMSCTKHVCFIPVDGAVWIQENLHRAIAANTVVLATLF